MSSRLIAIRLSTRRLDSSDWDIQSHWLEQVVMAERHHDVVSSDIDQVNACFGVIPFASVLFARKDWDLNKTAGT